MEKGRYRGRAAEWAWGVSSKNNEQLAVAFDFLDHPGQRETKYFSFTDAAFDYSVKALRACGWQGEELDNLDGLDANEVQLVVDWEDDGKGGKELRIQFVNQAGGIALKTIMEPAAVATFAQRMRGRVQQADREAGRRTAPTSSQNQDRPPV